MVTRSVVVLTNLPPQVHAVKTSQLYLERWSVERLFQVVTEEFHCEIKTLCYPRAALFVFAMALLAYNLFSAVKAALRTVHGAGKIDAGLWLRVAINSQQLLIIENETSNSQVC